MASKQFFLLQTVQAGIGFDENDERVLTAVSTHIQPDQLLAVLPSNGERLRPLLTQWARNNMLTPHDDIYAQRLWILALTGAGVGISLTALSEAIQSLYQQVLGLLPPEQAADSEKPIQKGMSVDIAMLAQCYDRLPHHSEKS